MAVKLNPDGECSHTVHPDLRLDPCEVCGSSGSEYRACSRMSVRRWSSSKPYTPEEIAAGVPDRKTLDGLTFVCEIPPGSGKLVDAMVFQGRLILAFEHGGVYVVRDGKLEPVTFAPIAPIGG